MRLDGEEMVKRLRQARLRDFLAFLAIPVYGAPVLRAVLVEGSAGRNAPAPFSLFLKERLSLRSGRSTNAATGVRPPRRFGLKDRWTQPAGRKNDS
jgi:hypothetical protein